MKTKTTKLRFKYQHETKNSNQMIHIQYYTLITNFTTQSKVMLLKPMKALCN